MNVLSKKNMFFALKILLAAIMIAFASWLSGKYPKLAGFIIALPLATIIALIFSYIEHKNPENTIIFAKSVLVAVPVSYFFFIPFFFAKALNNNFWLIYLIGLSLLIIAFFVHKFIVSFF